MAKEIGRLLTAMITPFKADGSVDYGAAEQLSSLSTSLEAAADTFKL